MVYILQSELGTLSSATLSRTLWEEGTINSYHWLLINGGFVAIAYAYALWFFFRLRMIRVTSLPVLMIFSSVGVGLLVALGRAQFMDWTGGTNYWYAVHTKFGLAGCCWIYAYNLTIPRKENVSQNGRVVCSQFHRAACYAIGGLMFLSVLLSNIVDWRRAPYVRRYIEAVVPYAFSPTPMPLNAQGLTPFLASPVETMEALGVFRHYGLTFYTNHSSVATQYDRDVIAQGKVSKAAHLGFGWHDLESTQRWMAGKSEIVFRTGPEGSVTVEGHMPGFLSPNTITLFADGKEIGSKTVNEGFFMVTAATTPNAGITLTINVSKHVVPHDVGLNADRRELGAIIRNIETQ
jgi:hypothetical protein